MFCERTESVKQNEQWTNEQIILELKFVLVWRSETTQHSFFIDLFGNTLNSCSTVLFFNLIEGNSHCENKEKKFRKFHKNNRVQ